MQVALMFPCYVDMFYPHVGIATLELLERLGVDVVYPQEQRCCGQPVANSGCYEEARAKRLGRYRWDCRSSGAGHEDFDSHPLARSGCR
jgi:Fe-S oxidoreductase